jgi:hypothetical protein
MGRRDRRKIQRALQRKGFQRSDNDHVKFIYFTLAGIKTSVWTKTSHGSKHKDLSDEIISNMAHQCRLSNRDFADDLVDCPLTREAYEALLVSTKQIVSTVDKS